MARLEDFAAVTERLLPLDAMPSVDECWEWPGYRNGSYGYIFVDGRAVGVHRVVYEFINGPIPDGMYVCHRCDNPPCANPGHLFVGTPKDNHDDMVRKGRRVAAQRLTDEQVADIRRRYVRGSGRWNRGTSAQLAEEFGVTVKYISALARGEKR